MLKGPGAMVFILCKTLEPLRLGLGGAESSRLSGVAPSNVKHCLGSEGVVGVADRDLFVGNGGKAQPWDMEISEDGGRKGAGDVALRDGIIRPDL